MEGQDQFETKIIYISDFIQKIIGLKIKKKDSKSRGFTFYDIKYKIGSDELKIEDALKLINETDFKSYNQGYTSKLRQEIVTDEKLCRDTVNNPPSMAPIVYAKTAVEYKNVQCWDITSAYPFLLTQPLPHYVDTISYKEAQFNDPKYIYYGGIEINNLKAKNNYYPLTLVGKNNKNISIEEQGENIIHAGVRIISADRVILYGFIPHIVELLKRNYSYSFCRISQKLVRFELKIDWKLREKIMKYFKQKQDKKNNKENYDGEKILLNRVYGYLITKGSSTPAHYGQYIVSKERLILDRIINEIGLKDVIHSHTDSIKFIGNHKNVIDKYNATIPFPELGRFVLEDVFQKCIYFSNITGKYIDKNGKLGLKHGGIDKIGITHLYKKSYEEINGSTKFCLVRGYFYLEKDGYYPDYTISDFNHSVEEEIE